MYALRRPIQVRGSRSSSEQSRDISNARLHSNIRSSTHLHSANPGIEQQISEVQPFDIQVVEALLSLKPFSHAVIGMGGDKQPRIPSSNSALNTGLYLEPQHRLVSRSAGDITLQAQYSIRSAVASSRDTQKYLVAYNTLAKQQGLTELDVAQEAHSITSDHHFAKPVVLHKRNLWRKLISSSTKQSSDSSNHVDGLKENSHDTKRVNEVKCGIQCTSLDHFFHRGGISILHLPKIYRARLVCVPACLAATGNYILQHGRATPGIFRIPGQAGSVNQLYQRYLHLHDSKVHIGDQRVGEDVACAELPHGLLSSPHDAASAFKRFIWDIPGGILGSLALYKALRGIQQLQPSDRPFADTQLLKAQLSALAILSLRSDRRIAVLEAVFGLLAFLKDDRNHGTLFHDNQSRSRSVLEPETMSSRALAVVFAPLLLGSLTDSISVPPTSIMSLTEDGPKRAFMAHLRTPHHVKTSSFDRTPEITNSIDRSNAAAELIEMLVHNWETIVGYLNHFGKAQPAPEEFLAIPYDNVAAAPPLCATVVPVSNVDHLFRDLPGDLRLSVDPQSGPRSANESPSQSKVMSSLDQPRSQCDAPFKLSRQEVSSNEPSGSQAASSGPHSALDISRTVEDCEPKTLPRHSVNQHLSTSSLRYRQEHPAWWEKLPKKTFPPAERGLGSAKARRRDSSASSHEQRSGLYQQYRTADGQSSILPNLGSLLQACETRPLSKPDLVSFESTAQSQEYQPTDNPLPNEAHAMPQTPDCRVDDPMQRTDVLTGGLSKVTMIPNAIMEAVPPMSLSTSPFSDSSDPQFERVRTPSDTGSLSTRRCSDTCSRGTHRSELAGIYQDSSQPSSVRAKQEAIPKSASALRAARPVSSSIPFQSPSRLPRPSGSALSRSKGRTNGNLPESPSPSLRTPRNLTTAISKVLQPHTVYPRLRPNTKHETHAMEPSMNRAVLTDHGFENATQWDDKPPVARRMLFRKHEECMNTRNDDFAYQYSPRDKPRHWNVGTLYAEIRRLRLALDTKDGLLHQMQQRYDAARYSSESAALRERLREMDRKMELWKRRAEWAESALKRRREGYGSSSSGIE